MWILSVPYIKRTLKFTCKNTLNCSSTELCKAGLDPHVSEKRYEWLHIPWRPNTNIKIFNLIGHETDEIKRAGEIQQKTLISVSLPTAQEDLCSKIMRPGKLNTLLERTSKRLVIKTGFLCVGVVERIVSSSNAYLWMPFPTEDKQTHGATYQKSDFKRHLGDMDFVRKQ